MIVIVIVLAIRLAPPWALSITKLVLSSRAPRAEFPFLKQSLNSHRFRLHVDKSMSTQAKVDGANPLRPLSEVQPGLFFRIKQLSASPEMSKRLRELGFCEEQRIKLLSRNPNLICQVCNARLGLSSHLADLIWVEKIKPQRLAA
jgi:Fe2+ transport system protein FeoA